MGRSKTKHWADDSLVLSPINYCLCLTKKEYLKVLKQCKVKSPDKSFVTNGADATTQFLAYDDGIVDTAIICLKLSGDESEEDIVGIIAHEAVHVWRMIKRIIGEDNPSEEFEAYSYQSIVQNLYSIYKGIKED